MDNYLVLTLISLWALLICGSQQCDFGQAMTGHSISLTDSLMSNADVAVLKTYDAGAVKKCMEECCTRKYGQCTIASFKRNSTNNCQHFNCQPVKKCKFQSSIDTDTFVFSSDNLQGTTKKMLPNTTQLPDTTIPDLNTFEEPKAKEEIAAPYSEEQTPLKNDNTTIKPRKGVENFVSPSNAPKSGSVKPRKGVGIQNVPQYPDTSNSTSQESGNSDDVISELQKVFEDDPGNYGSSQIVPSAAAATSLDTVSSIHPPISVSPSEITTTDMVVGSFSDSSLNHVHSFTIHPTTGSTPVLEISTYSTVSSMRKSSISSSSSSITSEISGISSISPTPVISASATLAEHSVPTKPLVSKASSTEDVDDDERKYRSSIHLVIALVLGLLVLLSVLVVVGKRMYDRWVRRDYFRMNYLIDGIYHGDD